MLTVLINEDTHDIIKIKKLDFIPRPGDLVCPDMKDTCAYRVKESTVIDQRRNMPVYCIAAVSAERKMIVGLPGMNIEEFWNIDKEVDLYVKTSQD